MRLHPLAFNGGLWTCAVCDCDAPNTETTFDLSANVEFPVTQGFVCYEVIVRNKVVIACTTARIVERKFSAREIMSRVGKITKKQESDLTNKLRGDQLRPGSLEESFFFKTLEKISKDKLFTLEERRRALLYASHLQLEIILYLYTLGFEKSCIIRSKTAAKVNGTCKTPCLWKMFSTSENLRKHVEQLVRQDPGNFFNEDTRPAFMRNLGPLNLTAFRMGSAASILQKSKMCITPLTPGFTVGRLKDAFVEEPPNGVNFCHGALGIVGPCREVAGFYISQSLAYCMATLIFLYKEGWARVINDISPNKGNGDLLEDGHWVIRHVNVMSANDLEDVLRSIDSRVLRSLTLTAPFDYDDGITSCAWRTLRTIFEYREPPDVYEMSTEKTSTNFTKFILVATCAEAKSEGSDDATWVFTSRDMTLAKLCNSRYERLFTNKSLAREEEYYCCREEEDKVYIPASCVCALPDRSIPIVQAVLPKDPEVALVVQRTAERVSNVTVCFIKK